MGADAALAKVAGEVLERCVFARGAVLALRACSLVGWVGAVTVVRCERPGRAEGGGMENNSPAPRALAVLDKPPADAAAMPHKRISKNHRRDRQARV